MDPAGEHLGIGFDWSGFWEPVAHPRRQTFGSAHPYDVRGDANDWEGGVLAA